MEFSQAEKDEIYEAVRKRVDRLIRMKGLAGDELHHEGACFYYAVFAVLELKARGVLAGLQAGSAGWARIRPEQDDGVMSTHFSYMWTPDEPNSLWAIANNLLPEMHVWAAALDEDGRNPQLVDLTSGFFPEQAKKLCGFDWPGDPPPKYLWTRSPLPRNCFYEARKEPVVFALKAVANEFGVEMVKELIPMR